MEHIAAFMLLVGCNADASVCKEIPVPVAAYEDQADCGRDLSLQMRLPEKPTSLPILFTQEAPKCIRIRNNYSGGLV